MTKPRMAVWKFASCDGCQLSLLDCEDEFMEFTEAIHIANFAEATRAFEKGPWDLTLVEGSITTPEDKERIQEIRQQSKFLVTIGACATSGGIQALKNFANVKEYVNTVYAHPEYIRTLETSTAISEHIKVDYELRGCPINKYQLLEVVKAFLQNRRPNIPNQSVCVDCKTKGKICVMVAHKEPCLGPVTHSGCEALCPTYNRGCYGCYGPKDQTNAKALAGWLEETLKTDPNRVHSLFANFNANSKEFRQFVEDSEKS